MVHIAVYGCTGKAARKCCGAVHVLMILELLLHPEAEEVDDADGHDCYGSCLAHGV